MLKSRGGLESDQQVVRKLKCCCPKCLCSSLSCGKTVGGKCVFKMLSEHAGTAHHKGCISPYPHLCGTYRPCYLFPAVPLELGLSIWLQATFPNSECPLSANNAQSEVKNGAPVTWPRAAWCHYGSEPLAPFVH